LCFGKQNRTAKKHQRAGNGPNEEMHQTHQQEKHISAGRIRIWKEQSGQVIEACLLKMANPIWRRPKRHWHKKNHRASDESERYSKDDGFDFHKCVLLANDQELGHAAGNSRRSETRGENSTAEPTLAPVMLGARLQAV
jgi:hypothetical protein